MKSGSVFQRVENLKDCLREWFNLESFNYPKNLRFDILEFNKTLPDFLLYE